MYTKIVKRHDIQTDLFVETTVPFEKYLFIENFAKIRGGVEVKNFVCDTKFREKLHYLLLLLFLCENIFPVHT